MKIDKNLTIDTVFNELARRTVQRRIALGLTQTDAAEQAGVSLRTLKNFESGNDCQLSTFLRLLQTYRLTGLLDQLLPESSVSPIEMFKRQPKTRRRASSPKTSSPIKMKSSKPWKWGDTQ